MYIADVTISLTPRSPKSRLHPVFRSFEKWPIVMMADGSVHHEMIMGMIKRALKGRVTDWEKYSVKYKCSNVKFSTKCNWTSSK